MDPKDRRLHPRYESTFHVDVLNMGDDPGVSQFEAIIPGTALDVSRQGMRLKVPYSVPVGSALSVILYSANGGQSICLCEVMWRREEMGEPLYGVFTKQWTSLDARLAKVFSFMEAQELPKPPSQPA